MQTDAHVDIWVALDNDYQWNNTNKYKPLKLSILKNRCDSSCKHIFIIVKNEQYGDINKRICYRQEVSHTHSSSLWGRSLGIRTMFRMASTQSSWHSVNQTQTKAYGCINSILVYDCISPVKHIKKVWIINHCDAIDYNFFIHYKNQHLVLLY